MNEKLIRRAALKYRTWLISQTLSPIQSRKLPILNSLDRISGKVSQIEKWTKLFFRGSLERTQYNEYDDVEYLGIACPSVYESIAKEMIPDLGTDVLLETKNTLEALKSLVTQEVITKISLKEAVDEIRVIVDSWPDVKFRCDILSVLIKDVVLEEDCENVELGDFWIHVNITRPMDSLRIESRDKVESSGGFTHPHVSGIKLCIGAGGLLSKEALCQGRLEDYFRIIESVLRTYNEHSPYEELREWYDPDHEDQSYCDICEEWRDNDCSYYCEGCNKSSCEQCDTGNCCGKCNDWRCGECIMECISCETTLCHRCANSCSCCHDTTCSNCLNLCNTCEESCCESCMSSCACCGDCVCESCDILCSCCEDNYCKDCVGETCNKCNGDICKECKTTCIECDKIICNDCAENSCEHCGVPICSTCESEHNCLLAEVSD